jgi:GTP-binding protein EngB required for normal cell division
MIKSFSEEKLHLIEKMQTLDERLMNLEQEFQLDLKSVRVKLNTALGNLRNEKFSMAFFGPFTNGKSTILSALLRRTDIEIDVGPTTRAINTYDYGDYFLVDTPGLFSEFMEHDAETRRYISEANVVLYVVDPTNPLQDVHHPTIKWLLKDLDKYYCTVFVLNKMDEVADLEDEEDFARNSEIKTEVVRETIHGLVKKKSDPMIIPVAADPWDRGLPYWFGLPEKYTKLSRIKNLDSEIGVFVESAKQRLIISAGLSVVKEGIGDTVQQLTALKKQISDQQEVLENQRAELSRQLASMERDVKDSYIEIKEEVLALREDFILAIEAAPERGDLATLINSRIGTDGNVLKERVNLIIEKRTKSMVEEREKFLRDLESSLRFHHDLQLELASQLASAGAGFGAAVLNQSTRTLADLILNTRTALGLPIRFQPWGAVRWATRFQAFGRFLTALPIVIDVIEGIIKVYDEYKLRAEKMEIGNEIGSLFDAFIESFDRTAYTKTYFPWLSQMYDAQKNLSELYEVNSKVRSNLERGIIELKQLQV